MKRTAKKTRSPEAIAKQKATVARKKRAAQRRAQREVQGALDQLAPIAPISSLADIAPIADDVPPVAKPPTLEDALAQIRRAGEMLEAIREAHRQVFGA